MTSLRVAILDDDEDVRGLLQRYLQQQGFEAFGAADATGLFKILDEHEIDLVVLDLMMPGEDGFQVCRRLRATDEQLYQVTMGERHSGLETLFLDA